MDFTLEHIQRLRNDPWYFLRGVRTLDEVDKKSPIKPFPIDTDYLKLFCKVWLKEPYVAVPKSRRMKITWTCVGLYTWDTMFHFGRFNAFVSKKEDDANFLVDRAKFILEHFDPEWIPKEIVPKWVSTFAKIEFPEIKSKIQGFPQGADQLRQYTFSGIFGDEMAFWDEAEAMYSASFPTLDGGGRFTAVSSPAEGFFRRLVFDQIDMGSGATHEEKKRELYVQ